MDIKLSDDLILLKKSTEIVKLLEPIVLHPFSVWGPIYNSQVQLYKKIDSWWRFVPILGQLFDEVTVMDIKLHEFNSIFDVDIHVDNKTYLDFAEKIGKLIEKRILNVKVTIVKDYLDDVTIGGV